MNTKTVYIAGPMSGIKYFNHPAFDAAELQLISKGWAVISPARTDRRNGLDPFELPGDYDWNQWPSVLDKAETIREDLDLVQAVDAIALLPGFLDSRGAMAEYHVARWCGKEVIYLGGESP